MEECWAEISTHKDNPEYPGQRDNYIKTSRYTLLSFVPLTLYENFKNLTNIYFTFILVISFLPASPVSWVFSFIPIVFVLVVSMVKLGVEDFIRYRSDKKNNSTIFEVFEGNIWINKASSDIRPGDIYRIPDGQVVPCDTFYLCSSDVNGKCYFSEASLNGETAIKPMHMHQGITGNDILSKEMKIRLKKPSRDLTDFNAVLEVDNRAFQITKDNILLRGMSIHYTEWAVGVACATGMDTKMALNSRHAPAKRTVFDAEINKMVIFIFFAIIFVCFTFSALYVCFNTADLFPQTASIVSFDYTEMFFETLVSFLVITSYMIPMCLVVIIEALRYIYSIYLQKDARFCKEIKHKPVVHNSNIISELGNVTHVLTDKTGTLTENKMVFNSMTDIFGETTAKELIGSTMEMRKMHDDMLLALALCNNVIVYKGENGIEYNAESPDEAAFVRFAKEIGYQLLDRDNSKIILNIDGETQTYMIEAIFPFTSARKRMSIVLRKEGSEEGFVLTKGADSVIYQRAITHLFKDSVNQYALNGYRTLVFAHKNLDINDMIELREAYEKANGSLSNREEMLNQISETIEDNIEVIGVTAIEDRLQPKVPETIEWLRQANIAVWVLTGDMLETAIEIGRTSNVIAEGSDVIILSNNDPNETEYSLKQYIENFSSLSNQVLVVSEKATEYCLSSYRKKFMDLAMRCKSVIFCRVSPFMKGQIVSAVKEYRGTVTLAIGDGGNDVGMIQESHVGIGIKGHEGTAAAQSSDIAITRFNHLRYLIGLHGHLALYRLPMVAVMIIYKNIVFITVVFLASADAKFSPNTYYNSFLITCYNFLFTILSPIAFGLFDSDLNSKTLIRYPQIHRMMRNPLKFPKLLYYLILAIVQGAIVYYVVRLACPYQTLEEGGNICYFTVVYLVTLQMSLWGSSFNIVQIGAIVATFVVLYGLSFGYAYLVSQKEAGPLIAAISSLNGEIAALLSLIISVGPTVIIDFLLSRWKPSVIRLFQERQMMSIKPTSAEIISKKEAKRRLQKREVSQI